MHKDPLGLGGSFITRSAWCELCSVTTTTPYSHQLEKGRGQQEKRLECKMHDLGTAINSPIMHFQGRGPFKTVLLSSRCPTEMGLTVAVSRVVSRAAPETQHKETCSPLLKPVKQFGKRAALLEPYIIVLSLVGGRGSHLFEGKQWGAGVEGGQ